MVLRTAMWVNGTTVVVQNPEDLLPEIPEKRLGWGSVFRGKANTNNWFHISIPTPIILEGQYPRLKKIFVLFHAQSWVKINSIHVYDGGWCVKDDLNNLNLTGSHWKGTDDQNTWLIGEEIYLKSGLGLSIGVNFGPQPIDLVSIDDSQEPNVQQGPRIYFAAAGADFEKD